MNTFNAIDSLRNFSLKIGAKFVENQNGGFLTLKNDFGKGNAKAFKLFPGLEALTFNITAHKEIVLRNFFKGKQCLHFIFCVEGMLQHQFDNDNKSKDILRLQNVIIGSNRNKSSKFTIAPKTRVQFSLITIVNINTLSKELHDKSQLSTLLSDVLEIITSDSGYTYFGDISGNTKPFVETLINTSLSGLSNRLINEASVFKTLSSQYTNHGKSLGNTTTKNPLSKSDTLKIVQLSEYISQNLHNNISLKSLTALSGLNQKKIQKGFQFFFDETVNKFITNLRILKAKELLEVTDCTISEIVYQIGLNSRSYFSKIFYAKYGLNPKEYRKYNDLTNPTFQLSYSSKADESITKKCLQDILKAAKEKNALHNITGCLIYHNGHFFQILEGPKNEVLALVETIRKDIRNTDLKILSEGVTSGRTFNEWSMALIEGSFSKIEKVDDFEVMPEDFLAIPDFKNPITNRYMWEKARNYLIVNQEAIND